MKKYFYLFLLASAPFMFTSCSDDDDEFTLQSSSVEVVNGSSGQIQYAGNFPSVKVANSFIATVDKNGRVAGKHAGHTVAYVGNKVVDINVKGTNSLIGDICYEWGKGKQYVLSKTTYTDFKKTNLSSSTYDTYTAVKTYNNQLLVGYSYLFTKNQDKLESASVFVHKSYASNLSAFLNERFYLVEHTDVIGSLLTGAVGIDSDDTKSATAMVTVATSADYPNHYVVVIMPYQNK